MPPLKKRGVMIGMSGENYLILVGPDEVYEVGPEVYYVWDLLDGRLGVEDLARRVAHELQLPLDKVRPLVYRIVDLLEKEGLAHPVD